MRTRNFLMLVAGLLTAALLSSLALNTMLAQGSFVRYDLMTRNAELGLQEQALSREVADMSAPFALQQRAANLGMVPALNPVYIDLTAGKVLGRPEAAEPPSALTNDGAGYIDPITGAGLASRSGTGRAGSDPAAANTSGSSGAVEGGGGERALGLRSSSGGAAQ